MFLAFVQWALERKSRETGAPAMTTPRLSLTPLSEEELELPDDPFMAQGDLARRSALGLGVMQLTRSLFFGRNFPNGLCPFFRRFGFDFWDERRMVALGFMASANVRFTSFPGLVSPGVEQI